MLFGMVMLTEHITRSSPAFEPWLTEGLKRAAAQFPKIDCPLEQEPPVPKEFFEPGFTWRDGIAQESLDRFVRGLDPARNPYLCSTTEMWAQGFTGEPYGRTI